ncbi:MAG: GNAT family N-acetyltransferase [Bacteroidetes bacterium]|nr:GNAT family N-acetyltransferase [Bacteroidota bacterium]
MSLVIESLKSYHRKLEFSCGKEMLDIYLHRQAKQDVKRKLSACFVLIGDEKKLIQGYYTLSSSTIPLNIVPGNIKKKLPQSYSSVPATLLGRLAVDNNYQGQGLGKLLLIDALKRSFEISKSIASLAVIVDPLDEKEEKFYKKYGFIVLPDSGKMFLSMKTISQLFK